MVVTQRQLVAEHGCQQLGQVVVEAPMPYPVLQFKQRFEPVIQRLDRDAAPGVLEDSSRAPSEKTTETNGSARHRRGIEIPSGRGKRV